jgi:hypothetical protein
MVGMEKSTGESGCIWARRGEGAAATHAFKVSLS